MTNQYHKHPEYRIRHREYMKEYRKKKPEIMEKFKKNNPKYFDDYNKKYYVKNKDYWEEYHRIYLRFTPVAKNIRLSYNPRIGVCNYCRNVYPFDCVNTGLHHDENRYDLDDPLRHTLELCNVCHGKETRRLEGGRSH